MYNPKIDPLIHINLIHLVINMFLKKTLKLPPNIFEELSKSANFQDVTGGRVGTVLVSPKGNSIPIVRTTTKYNVPAQPFQDIHFQVIQQIKEQFKELENIEFNNALIEIYDPKYKKMGYHSDQAIDLADDSYICLFSCYEDVENYTKDIRKLVVKEKGQSDDTAKDILLENNSCVLFSTDTNKRHLHKIVLHGQNSTCRWFGLTLRLSKTYINFDGNTPVFEATGKPLQLCDEKEKQIEFYKMRSQENKLVDYRYPDIDYTISKSDLMFVE